MLRSNRTKATQNPANSKIDGLQSTRNHREVHARLIMKSMKKVSEQTDLLITTFLDTTGEVKAIGWGQEDQNWYKQLQVTLPSDFSPI